MPSPGDGRGDAINPPLYTASEEPGLKRGTLVYNHRTGRNDPWPREDEPSDPEPAPDGTREFVDFAVEYLVLTLGEDHPTIKVGRRIVAALEVRPHDNSE